MNWYLVFTKPKEEDKVERQFSNANIDCLCPKLKRTTVRMNRIMPVIEPLFPRYMFVKTDLEENYRKIKYTRGVIGFVDFGFGPVSVDHSIVTEIKSREVEGYINCLYKRDKFSKNERLRIKRGVLKDLDVVFDGYLSGEERVCLLINNISSNIKLNIPKYYL